MALATVDRLYNEIMLLSDSNKYILYDRIKEELYYDSKIVAYLAGGKPLTRKEYVEQINVGLKQIDNGEVITDYELQREIETW
jgi:hypothetical protein